MSPTARSLVVRRRKYQRLAAAVAAACGVALTGSPTHEADAATITWGAPTAISGDADVSRTGTLMGAFNVSGSAVTINGVTFSDYFLADAKTFTAGDFLMTDPAGFQLGGGGSFPAPFANLSTGYQTLLNSFAGNAAGSPATLTMTGLTVGSAYEFQWWSNLSWNSAAYLTGATAGSTVILNSNTSGPPLQAGGLGQFAVGTFVADTTSQTITFDTPGGFYFVDAFQLRDIVPSLPANITWGSPTLISGDADVSTAGTLVGAFNIIGATATINGVAFNNFPISGTSSMQGNFVLANPTGFQAGAFGSFPAPFDNLSTGYQTLLNTFAGDAAGEATTLTMKSLTLGRVYQFQWWSNLSWDSAAYLTSATAGSTVILNSNISGPPLQSGGLGQFAVGTFVAEAGSQTITFDTPGGFYFLDAFQLRELGASVAYWTGDQSTAWTTINTGNTNWATTAAGTTDTAILPNYVTDVIFSASNVTAGSQTTTLGADFTIRSLTIQDAAAVTIGGANTLTISGVAGTGIDVQTGAGLFTLSAPLTLAGASNTITVNNAAGAVINAAIGGTIGLTKDGAGTLALGADNSYTGTTTIKDGTLLLSSIPTANLGITGNAVVIGDGAGAAGSAVLRNAAFGENINNSAAVTIKSDGLWDIAVFNETIGSLAGDAGSSVTLTDANSRLIAGGDGTSTTYRGAISGLGRVLKNGAGTWTLTGANSFAGGTTITGGTLLANNTAGSATGTGEVLVQTGATLGGSGFIAGPVTVQSGGHLAPGTSPGTLGTGTLVLESGSFSDFELGVPLVVGGASNDLVNVTGNLTLDGTLGVTDAGSFATGVYRLFNYTGSLTNNTMDVGTVPAGFVAGDFTIQTAISGQVNLIAKLNEISPVFWDGAGPAGDGTISGGAGTWNATNANWADGTGDFTIPWPGTTGVFAAPGGAVTVDGTLAFEALQFMDNGYVVDATGGSALTPTGAATITVENGVTTLMSVPLTGPGSLEKLGAGQLTLTGTSSYTGGTTITAGVLQLGNGGTTGSLTGDVLNDSALIFNRSNNYNFTGVISGSGTVTQNGTGTLRLSAPNSYTGGTFLNSGTLLAGNDSALGTGLLTINGGTLGSSGNAINLANAVLVNSDFNVAPRASGQFRLRLDGDIDLGGAVREITNVVDGTELSIRGAISNGGVTFLAGAGHTANYVYYEGSGVNTYTGLTTVGANVGMVLDRPVNDSAISGDFLIEAGGTAVVLRNEQINDNATVTVNSTGNANFAGSSGLDLVFFNERIGRLEGTGSVGLGAGILRVSGGDFSGTIQDGSYATGGSLIKRSNDVLNLTGANTYTGATIINEGRLRANNTAGSATGSGPVSIEAGAALAGAGSVSGSVTLNDNGRISPGATGAGSAGTLTAGSLIWNGGGRLRMELGGVSDLLALGGTFGKGTAGTFNVNVFDAGGIGNQSQYTLVTFAGNVGFAATDFTLVTGIAGLTGTFSMDGDSLDLLLASTATGPIIQNSGPVFTPTFADFTVNGPVTTGGPTENNTIRTLTFAPRGLLAILNTLWVTQGPVNLTGGSLLQLGNTAGTSGFLSANLLNVLFGSTLNGNGGINGHLVNSGLVSPGNSPGMIAVSQNYTQTSSGTLRIEIGGADESEFDRLLVGGRALLDGTLELARLNRFKLKRGQRIEFLTANGGVEGEFATIRNAFTSDTILEPTVVYGDTSVALEMVRGSFEKYAANWGLTPNQRAVAEALDSVSADEPDDQALVYLDERKLDKLPGDFDKIAPEELTSIFTISTSLANVQSTNLQRRTDNLRQGASGFSASGLAMQGSGPGYSGSLFGAAGPSGKEVKEMKEPAPLEEKKWGAFLTGVGEWVDVGGDGNARGYDITTGGFTLGLDYKVCPNFAIGIAAGYAGTAADLTDDGRVWVNGGKLGLYATTFVGGWYADAAVTGGYNSYDTKRSALQGTARGDTEGGELNVLAGTGYDWKVGALTIGPTATFQYTLVGIDGFTETGSLAPLNIAGRNAESVRTALGFKASYDWKVGGVLVRPEIRASWQHEYGDSSYGLDASFANGAGGNFLVNGPEIGRDSLLIGAGVAIQCSERFSTYFYYDGEIDRSNYDRHGVSGGLRVAF